MSYRSTEKFFEKKRKWSLIKDELLSCYLRPYFTKIFYTRRKTIYIDGFAGKGKFDDGGLGSPIIAYNVVNDVAESFNLNKDMYEFVFIEKKYGEDLEENVKNLKNVTVRKDKYQNCIVDLLKSNNDKNIFLYVDPFGIKDIQFEYFKEAYEQKLNSIEILLNLNSFGFLREACNLLKVNYDIPIDEDDDEFAVDFGEKNSIENMDAVAGGTYWQKIICEYKEGKFDGYEAEKLFSKQYCENLNINGNFKYVINLPIRMGIGYRPKYRMVFATNNLEAILLMNDNMANRGKKICLILNNGHETLFPENIENEIIDENDYKSTIIEILKENNGFLNINDLMVKFISIVGIYHTSKIKDIIKKLEDEKVINIERMPPLTPSGKVSKFMDCKDGKKVYISLVRVKSPL